MYEGIGRSLGTDYFRIADQLTTEELGYLRRTREFVDDEVLPVINGYWERAEFPWPLVEKLAKLGIVGDGIEGYGCPSMSPIATGLVHMELNGGEWVVNGAKKWIGNGTIADVVVVWARDIADGKVKGFLVEKGTPGFEAKRIDGKGSLRAVWQAEIALSDVRVPEQNRLPGAHSFKDAGRVLAGTRNAVAWGALGHATAAYEVAVAYCRRRQQFGKPLASFQIVQDRLVKMLAEVCSMQLYCLRLGRLIEEGRLTDTIAAIAKMNNTRKARQVIFEARDLLGGNGILLDFHVMRHMADIEAIHTYEGTETIQTLIVGRDITGASAFT